MIVTGLFTTHSSGKLARRGLAIQELDLQICTIQEQRTIWNADALPCSPIPRPKVEGEVAAKEREGTVNALVCDDSRQEIGAKQDDDPSLQAINRDFQPKYKFLEFFVVN